VFLKKQDFASRTLCLFLFHIGEITCPLDDPLEAKITERRRQNDVVDAQFSLQCVDVSEIRSPLAE
jgi:hypothetical protein